MRDKDTASLGLSLEGRFSDVVRISLSGGTDLGRHTNTAWGGLEVSRRF